jgi:hypothetical protein
MIFLTLEQGIANGAQQIATIATNLSSSTGTSGGGTYTDVDAQKILDSLTALTGAQTNLITTLNSKEAVFKSNPVAATIINTAVALLNTVLTVSTWDERTNNEQN